MGPPRYSVPAPKTESAREARKNFFCELCQKGYSRMNEFEAHEGSYDHLHKKRLKEMKQMTRDSEAIRRAERKVDTKDEVMKPMELKPTAPKTTSGGFKKGGFKSAFTPVAPAPAASNDGPKTIPGIAPPPKAIPGVAPLPMAKRDDLAHDNEDDFGWEYYNPTNPSGCGSGCAARK